MDWITQDDLAVTGLRPQVSREQGETPKVRWACRTATCDHRGLPQAGVGERMLCRECGRKLEILL